jgi:putative zinc finger protein
MTRAACTRLQTQELTEYWLGELDEARERAVDEHLFACAACSERLSALVDLGAAIRGAFLEGWLNLALPEAFLRRIKDAGFKVREYDLAAGGSVSCTVTPDDDFVVAHLRAPLRGVKRLDVLIDDTTSGKHRANDVAFDPEAAALVTMTSTAYLKTLKHSQQRVRLVAVDGVEERVVADYTFNHYPS